MPRGEHRPSVLLAREENEQVFSLIGPKCQVSIGGSLVLRVIQGLDYVSPAVSADYLSIAAR